MLPKMTTTGLRLSAAVAGAALLALAQKVPPELGMGWLQEFNLAARQTVALAEAIPADKYSWRPGPGVRSVSEVLVHIAAGNYFLLNQAGVKLPAEVVTKLQQGNPEKSITAKADVIQLLKASQELVRIGYQTADRTKKVTFFGSKTTADGVFLRLLVHNHEHMGQSIAYARMIGVVPPWSQ
jgi:uncharacterized damage-inducible protein DinB